MNRFRWIGKFKGYVFPVFLIIGGSALESVWYFYRFYNEVPFSWMAVFQACFLVLLLSTFTWLGKTKHRKWFLPMIPLMFYSVLCTSVGQQVSMTAEETASIEVASSTSSEYMIDYYQNEIEGYDEEERTLLGAKNSVGDIQTAGMWRTTVSDNETRLDEVRRLRSESAAKLEALINDTGDQQAEVVRSKSVYSYLAGISSWSLEDWIRFILQSVLSLFIAIMSPVGIIAMPTGHVDEEELEEAQEVYVSKEDVVKFVNFSWFRVAKNISDNIIPKAAFMGNNTDFHEEVYDRLYKACIDLGIIGKNGIVIERDQKEAAKMIWSEVK